MKASKLLKKSVQDFFSSLRRGACPRLAPFFEHECVRKTAVDPSTAPHAAKTPQRAGLRGLYAIADTAYLDDAHLIGAVEQAIAGGARVIQYRDKRNDAATRLRQSQTLARLCHDRSVIFLVNDDVVLAKESGADGVHLGREDMSLEAARTQLGADKLIGVSCYNELERALTAEKQGADYVAFGSFFPSRTKPQAVRATLDLLREARRQLKLPIVAIGGITPENGAGLVEAGVDMLAVIEGVFGQPDIRAAARRHADLFLHV